VLWATIPEVSNDLFSSEMSESFRLTTLGHILEVRKVRLLYWFSFSIIMECTQ